jgi:alkylated DNA nucleotide flippase Atl1
VRRDIARELQAAMQIHLERVRLQGLSELEVFPSGALITYGELCALAANPVIPQGVGRYLTELAKSEGSPLDALVVNKRTGVPGAKFNSGVTLNRDHWKQAVVSVLSKPLANH